MIEMTVEQLCSAYRLAHRIQSLEHSKKDAASVEAYLCGNITVTLSEEFVLEHLNAEIKQRAAELSALGIVLTG
jgi:hypothetical protein